MKKKKEREHQTTNEHTANPSPNHGKTPLQFTQIKTSIHLVDFASAAAVLVCIPRVPSSLAVLLQVDVHHLESNIAGVLVLSLLLVLLLVPLVASLFRDTSGCLLLSVFGGVFELAGANDLVLCVNLNLTVAPATVLEGAKSVELDDSTPVLHEDEGANVPEPAARRARTGPREVHESLHHTGHEDVAREGHQDEHVLLPEGVEENGHGPVHHGEGGDHLVERSHGEPRVLAPHGTLEEEHLDVRTPRVAAPAEELRAELGALFELCRKSAHLD